METRHYDENKNKNLNEAFDSATEYVKGLAYDPGFQSYCAEQQISNDQSSLEYWTTVAEFQQANVDPDADPFDSYVQTIVAATPDAILRNTILDEKRVKYHEAHGHKQVLSYYNSLIRNFVDTFPDTKASELAANLKSAALSTVAKDSRHLQSKSAELTKAIVRGAQHEAAFGAMLESLGFPYRTATLEEDLKGMDYVVEVPGLQKPIGVDVKASLSEIEAKNHQSDGSGPFAFGRDGNLVIWSMVTDAELNDGFVVPEQIVAERAPLVMGGLFQASKRQSA